MNEQKKRESPRQELSRFLNDGSLRQLLSHRAGLSDEAKELVITVLARYCEPRRRW